MKKRSKSIRSFPHSLLPVIFNPSVINLSSTCHAQLKQKWYIYIRAFAKGINRFGLIVREELGGEELAGTPGAVS
jgi:hypothetical protein